MHTKQSGKLCYLTTAHTNQTIESQSLNFNYGEKDYEGKKVNGSYLFYEEYDRVWEICYQPSIWSMDNIEIL